MKVLVTGGAGFIGSHIVGKLLAQGYEVVVVDNMYTGCEDRLHPAVTLYKADIASTELEDVMEFERPDYVIHQAAQIDVQSSLHDPLHDAQTNILGTINLLVQCGKLGVTKFVYASSAAAYGHPESRAVDEQHPIRPISFYGVSKSTPEHYIRVCAELYGLSFVILRYSNVYGIGQDPRGEGGVISIFMDRTLRGQPPIIYGDGEQTRDFIYVSDVANANVHALQYGRNITCNISCNKQTTINELTELLGLLSGSQLPPLYKEERRGDIRHSRLDNSRAIRELHWKPKYSLLRGLQETYQHYLHLNKERAQILTG